MSVEEEVEHRLAGKTSLLAKSIGLLFRLKAQSRSVNTGSAIQFNSTGRVIVEEEDTGLDWYHRSSVAIPVSDIN